MILPSPLPPAYKQPVHGYNFSIFKYSTYRLPSKQKIVRSKRFSLFCKQGFRDTKAIFCLLGKLPNPHRTLPAASSCASVPDASMPVPAKEKSPVQHEHYTHTAPDFPSSTTLSIFFFLPHFLLMHLLFFLLVLF